MCLCRKFAVTLLAVFLALPLATAAFSESKAIVIEPVSVLPGKRVALVVGNASYGENSPSGVVVSPLKNPVKDAQAIRDTLTKLGFQVVYGEDLTKKQLERAIGTFAGLVEDADVAITYFSGHGSTFGDVPYLVPVDAEFNSLSEVPYELVKVEDFIGELRGVKAKGVRIALIDACRDDDADQALKRASSTKGVGQSKGLARVAHPDGLIIMYATQFLTTADDGNGDNSPFAAALVRHLPTPGEDVTDILGDVARDVETQTDKRQRPELSISMYDKFILNPGAVASAVPSPPEKAVPIPPPPTAEIVFWQSIENSTRKEDFQAYLTKFPDGTFATLARLRLAALEPVQPEQPKPPVAAVPAGPVPPGPPAKLEEAPKSGASADESADCARVENFALSITACTAVIASGSVSGQALGEIYANRGGAYDTKGDYDLAIADLNKAIELNPNSSYGHLNRAIAYASKRDFSQALPDFDQAARLAPSDAKVYVNRGIAYGAMGDVDRAIDDFDQAIIFNPRYATAYFWRGAAYAKKGTLDRSLADYKDAARLLPANDTRLRQAQAQIAALEAKLGLRP